MGIGIPKDANQVACVCKSNPDQRFPPLDTANFAYIRVLSHVKQNLSGKQGSVAHLTYLVWHRSAVHGTRGLLFARPQ